MTANLVPVPDPEVPAPAGPFDLPIDGAGMSIPTLRVTPMDGPAYTVQPLNPDMLLYEDTAQTHRWRGGATDTPFRWMTFLAWAASRRTGVIDAAVTWDAFKQTTAEVASVGATPVTPTRPGPAPG